MTMQEIEILERLTIVEERSKSNNHAMSNTMVQLVEEVKHTNETMSSLDEKVERINRRVDVIERAPAEDMKAYRRTATATAVSAIAGAFAAGALAWLANYI